MMHRLKTIILIIVGLALIGFALINSERHKKATLPSTQSMAIPASLQYQENPIDPVCFKEFPRQTGRFTKLVNLAECGRLDKNSQFDGSIQERDNGELFRELKCGADCFGAAYIGYRYIGPWQNEELVEINNAEGGTSQYTSLTLINRSGDTLHIVKDIAAGDRCNGGIGDTAIKNGHLTYTQYATPAGLIGLAKLADIPAEALNLSDDATNCVAEAHFTDGQLSAITLTQTAEDIQPISQDGADEMQACFNQIYVGRVNAKQTELSPAAFAKLAREFKASCMASADNHAVAE